MRNTLLLIALISSTNWLMAQNKSSGGHWPRPTNVKHLLFYIQRDPDSNTVCYTANLSESGELQKDDPVSIFWMKYATDGRRKELTTFQRQFGYGLKIKNIGSDSIEMRMIALPARPLYLTTDGRRGYHVLTLINGKRCILDRVYIRIVGGTSISPDVEYIELTGLRAGSDYQEKERIFFSK